MEKMLKDRVAIITGAASGIGKASALLFAEEGAKVVISDLNEKAGNEVVELINNTGGEAFFVKADVSSEEDVKNVIERTVERFGGIDILFNNAGIAQPWRPFEEMPIEELKRIMDINFYGPYYGAKYALPYLEKSKHAVILTTSSCSGVQAQKGSSAYCASKAAINMLSNCMAKDLGKKGIRVNTVCPSVTSTPILDGVSEQQMANMVKAVPLKRIAQPEDQARVALFLASDLAGYVTGQNVKVDGGSL
jgi:NAD(P)-dependent dehydrogenase (short-subunit alcohol dehydrogenase family)